MTTEAGERLRWDLRAVAAARYAIGMRLMMRIVQWLAQPAAAFVYAARW